jgi:hypothetical protein
MAQMMRGGGGGGRGGGLDIETMYGCKAVVCGAYMLTAFVLEGTPRPNRT